MILCRYFRNVSQNVIVQLEDFRDSDFMIRKHSHQNDKYGMTSIISLQRPSRTAQ